MALRVLACVRESVFLKGLESVFPEGDLVFCGGAVDEATLFDMLPQAKPDALIYELAAEQDLPYLSILHRNFPELGIFVLLEPEHEHFAAGAMERGAAECLPKTLTRETLFANLRSFDRSAPERDPCRTEADSLEVAAVGTRVARRLAGFRPGGVERIDLTSLFASWPPA